MPITENVILGKNVHIHHESLVNLYGCEVGDDSKIGTFVEVQKNVQIGCRCKISSHTFICEGVTIGDEVFIGHGVMFTNDLFPRATTDDGNLQNESDWEVIPTFIKNGVSIGSGSVILCGITVGEGAMIGAGSVVTRDVAAGALVYGVPAKERGSAKV